MQFCGEEIDIIRPTFRNITLGYNEILSINPVGQMNWGEEKLSMRISEGKS